MQDALEKRLANSTTNCAFHSLGWRLSPCRRSLSIEPGSEMNGMHVDVLKHLLQSADIAPSWPYIPNLDQRIHHCRNRTLGRYFDQSLTILTLSSHSVKIKTNLYIPKLCTLKDFV